MKNFKVMFVYPNQMGGVIPSNLPVISACLKQAYFQVKLFDASMYKISQKSQDEVREKLNQVKKTDINKYFSFKPTDIFEDFVKEVEEYKPDLIAITFVDETMPLGFSLLEKIRDKKIPVVAGGVTAIFASEILLKNPDINIVCVGEGEEAIVELCDRMYNGEDYNDLKNFYFKNEDGTIKKNPIRPLVDLNKLPYPDYSIFDDTRFYRPFHGEVVRMIIIDTDRGCPFGCTFCAAPGLRDHYRKNNCGVYYRTKKINRVIDEMKELITKYRINFIWFSSETFLIQNDDAFKEFVRRYKEEINLPFWCQTRLDTFTEEKTKLLSEMGCKAMSIGFEHGDDVIRNGLMKKNISEEQIINAFKIISKYDIIATVNSMIGLPDETREQVFKTIELNRKIYNILKGKCSVNTFIFSPFHGTPLRELCVQKGYLKDPEKIPNFYSGSILDLPTLSKEEIIGFERVLPLYIKLPEEYFPKIAIAEKDTEEGRKMFEELCEIYTKYNY